MEFPLLHLENIGFYRRGLPWLMIVRTWPQAEVYFSIFAATKPPLANGSTWDEAELSQYITDHPSLAQPCLSHHPHC